MKNALIILVIILGVFALLNALNYVEENLLPEIYKSDFTRINNLEKRIEVLESESR